MQLGIEDIEILQTLEQYAANNNVALKSLEAGIGLDYIGELAEKGYLSYTLGRCGTEIGRNCKKEYRENAAEQNSQHNTSCYEAAGASSVQELAFALATAIYYIRHLQIRLDD